MEGRGRVGRGREGRGRVSGFSSQPTWQPYSWSICCLFCYEHQTVVLNFSEKLEQAGFGDPKQTIDILCINVAGSRPCISAV